MLLAKKLPSQLTGLRLDGGMIVAAFSQSGFQKILQQSHKICQNPAIVESVHSTDIVHADNLNCLAAQCANANKKGNAKTLIKTIKQSLSIRLRSTLSVSLCAKSCILKFCYYIKYITVISFYHTVNQIR